MELLFCEIPEFVAHTEHVNYSLQETTAVNVPKITKGTTAMKKSITVVTTAVRMEQVVWMVLSRTLAFALMAGKGLIAHKTSTSVAPIHVEMEATAQTW